MGGAHRLDLRVHPVVPGEVKPVVFAPGGVHIDRQRAVLNTADILLDRAQFPRNRQAVLEERGRDHCSQKHAEIGNEPAQGIEHRHHLRSVTESVC